MDSGEKALMLSSFFLGNGLLQIPMGAAGRTGIASHVVVLSLGVSGLLTILLPLGASFYGVAGVCSLRFLIGLALGALSPNVYNLMSKWTLPREKDFHVCLVNTGVPFGSLLTTALSGYIGYNYDWPSICYFNGAIAVPWAVLQLIVGSEDAEECSYISQEERELLKSCSLRNKLDKYKAAAPTPQRVPWRKVLTSVPVLALMVDMWCFNWCAWTVISLIPSYISGVHGFDLQENGFLSSLPFLAACICGIFIAFFAPFFKRVTGLEDSFLQPFWNSLGQYGSCLCLVLLAFLPVDTTGAVTLLVVGTGANMFCTVGCLVSILKLAPNFSGIIAGICSAFGTTATILGPLLSTYFLTDMSDLHLWRVVYLVAAAITFIGNTVYIIWGSSEPQPWNEPEERKEGF